MKVLFSGGGTGGHISPALAMADIIKTNVPNSQIAFVGTEYGIENTLIPQAGYQLYHVNVRGISRSFSLSNINSLYLALTSPIKARRIIKEFAPDIVIGTGGYACWPALKAAADMGIPTMLHESNALPGMAVRKLQNTVDVILTNFESTAEKLSPKAKVINVGNPLRSACNTLSKEDARKKLGIGDNIKFVVLSFGGSMGAERINHAAAEMMGNFASKHEDIMCFHVGGKKNFESARSYFSAYGLERNKRFVLMEYTAELPTYMAAADVVICRAGAMTLTEIAKMQKPAIIVPSPNVTDNHQYKNAKVLGDADAAIVICEDEIKEGDECKVCEAVKKLYHNETVRIRMSENVKQFSKPDVEKKIFEAIQDLLAEKKK